MNGSETGTGNVSGCKTEPGSKTENEANIWTELELICVTDSPFYTGTLLLLGLVLLQGTSSPIQDLRHISTVIRAE